MTYPGGRQDVGVWRGTKLIKLKFAIQEASFNPWSIHPLSSCHSLGSPDLKSRGNYGPMGPLEVSWFPRSWFHEMSLPPFVSKSTPFAEIPQMLPWLPSPFLSILFFYISLLPLSLPPSTLLTSFPSIPFPFFSPSRFIPSHPHYPLFIPFFPPPPSLLGGFPGTDSGSCWG